MSRRRAQLAATAFVLALACGKSAMEFSEQAVPTPFGGADAPISQATEKRLRLMGRTYVASVLREIFGPSVESVIFKQVELQNGAFGGNPCDPGRRFPSATNPDEPIDDIRDCPDFTRGFVDYARLVSGQSQTELVPVGTTGRMGYTVRACDQIVSQDTAVNTAIQRIGGNPSVKPSDADVRAAFDAFHPGRVPSEAVVTALKGVSDAGASALEGWRFLLATLCYSPSWQIP